MFARLLWGSFRVRRGRVALALLAVTLGAGMATALATLALQVGDDVALALRAAGPNFLIQPQGADWTPDLGGADVTRARAAPALAESTVALLKQSFWRHNVLHAAPELPAGARLGTVRTTVIGTWFRHPVPTDDGAWITGLAGLHPTWKIEGRWPAEDRPEIALGRDLAHRLGARPGQVIEAKIHGQRVALQVAGVVNAGGPEDAAAWMPLPLVQGLTARPGQADRVWMSALVKPGREEPPPDAERDPRGYERYMCTAYPTVVAADLAGHLPGAEVLPATERIAGEAHIVTRLTLLMVLLALAALAASTLGLLSTTTATVVERATELALLRAIGASPRQLASLLLGETVVVSLAGGALGWWIGSLGAAAIRGAPAAAHAGFGASVAFHALLLPVALAIALGVGLVGTLAPLRLALRLDPARVLRD